MIFFASCETYDKAIIYHPNYNPGQSKMLRFDGYYSDTLKRDFNEYERRYFKTYIVPDFYYMDGTCMLGGILTNMDTVASHIKKGWSIGEWANYKISNDTIYIEWFDHDHASVGLHRVYITGIILPDKIYFPTQVTREGGTPRSAYYTFFHQYDLKPDSTENWIRKNKFYNKKTK